MSLEAFIIICIVVIVIVAIVRNAEKETENQPPKDLAKTETAIVAVVEDPDPTLPANSEHTYNGPWRKYRVCECKKYLPVFPIKEHEKTEDERLKADGICPDCALPSDKMVEKVGRTFQKDTTTWYIDKSTDHYRTTDRVKRIKKSLNYRTNKDYGIEYKEKL